MRSLNFVVVVCALACSLSANADVIHFQDTVSLATTDWVEPVQLPQFNPALGTLQSVELQLHGYIQGTAFYENREAAPTLISLNLSGIIELLDSSLATVLSANPSVTIMEFAAAYDGTFDFGGDSGSTFSGLMDDRVVSVTYPPPPGALPAFVGLGTVDYTVSALGNSTGSGPGNWAFGFILQAAADVDITYTYLPIPEPAAFSLSCFVAAALLLRRRSRTAG